MKFETITLTTNRTICFGELTTNLTNYYSEKASVGNFRFPIRRCFGSAEKITAEAFSFGIEMKNRFYDETEITIEEIPANSVFENFTGRKIGRLTVIGYAGKDCKYKAVHWFVKCDCGNVKKVSSHALKSSTKSCGCLNLELITQRAQAQPRKPQTECLVDGCDRINHLRGLCLSHYTKQRREENPELFRKWDERKRRRQGVPPRQKSELTYNERHPEKYKARYILNNAIKQGKVERKPCEKCGSLRSQGHHPDYSKPLEVMWLCVKHHHEEHSLARKFMNEFPEHKGFFELRKSKADVEMSLDK